MCVHPDGVAVVVVDSFSLVVEIWMCAKRREGEKTRRREEGSRCTTRNRVAKEGIRRRHTGSNPRSGRWPNPKGVSREIAARLMNAT